MKKSIIRITFLGVSYTIPNATNGVINFYLSVPIF